MHTASHRFTLVAMVAILGGLAQAACSGADAEPAGDESTVTENPTFPAESGAAPIKEAGSPPSDDDAGTSTGDAGAAPTGATCATNGAKATEIEDNHTASPHKLADLPAADFKEPQQGDRRYTLSPGGGSGGGGGQTHTHTVTLTSGQRAELAKGLKPLTRTSSGANGNVHVITFTCK